MAKTKKIVKKANPAKKTVVTKKGQKKVVVTNSKKKAVAQKKAVKPKAVVKSKAITKAKTTPAKKAPVKKAPIKKVIVKKASVKKIIPAKKVVTKKIVAKAKTAPVKKAPVKKVIIKKAPVKKSVPAKKVIAVKKPAVKKVVAKKVTAKAKPVQKPVVVKKQDKKLEIKTIKKAQIPVKKMSVNTKDASIKERSKYSDFELLEFKKIILDKLDTAHKDLELLTEAFTNSGGNSTDDTSPTFKVLEEGSQVLSKEENSQLAARLNKFIQNLEAALVRIENKTYGICRVTGKLIPKERLRSVPHATLSIEAKEGR